MLFAFLAVSCPFIGEWAVAVLAGAMLVVTLRGRNDDMLAMTSPVDGAVIMSILAGSSVVSAISELRSGHEVQGWLWVAVAATLGAVVVCAVRTLRCRSTRV